MTVAKIFRDRHFFSLREKNNVHIFGIDARGVCLAA
jgi:hypothetical protein